MGLTMTWPPPIACGEDCAILTASSSLSAETTKNPWIADADAPVASAEAGTTMASAPNRSPLTERPSSRNCPAQARWLVTARVSAAGCVLVAPARRSR